MTYNNNKIGKEDVYARGAEKALQGKQPKLNWIIMQALANAMERLWRNDILKQTYNLRGIEKYAIIENLDYFFDRIHQLFQPDYHPSVEDMIKVPIRTTGIVQAFYQVDREKDIFLHFFD
ncbi:G-protein alpha subunit, partial [Reticulomyxa filosa]